MRTVFDSAAFAAPDRLAAWESATSASLIPTEIASPDPLAFTARLGVAALGDAQVTSLSYTSLFSRRSPRAIRICDPEFYQVGLIGGGRQRIDQDGVRAVLVGGQFVIYDSSRPFEAVTGDGISKSIVLQFPKRLLPVAPAQIARLCATPLPATHGIGRLLAQFLVTVRDDHDDYTGRDAKRLGHTAVDLTTAMVAHHLERDDPPLRSPSHVLYLQIMAYVERHLDRPGLAPGSVASAHRISLRYLHRIFQQHHHTSVAAHIRTRRLERAARDLLDPRLTQHTVASIATRWGFDRPSDFSRAFRHHTGLSPHEYRRGPQ
ncbi:helix-turn-helix domain-containing protein [Paractinoplanes brasiliensis]|uniref:AraC-like DNA-binding protein n=1 Tax=Paractinoplanes brasiliensis TaxID=52695 RepID=A0A4R6J975_9ACTN|nr:helix-turn-helix domain-containing protein [Actinoplanes brasiliensis]TDO32149.1 AraC-like DNA-binding protein [Actinoplanes brasiliensis]GID28203.1 AraC family transcriptional regulator [Actinoplanes brasiliensis]